MKPSLALIALLLFVFAAPLVCAAEPLSTFDIKIIGGNCTDAPMRVVVKDAVLGTPVRAEVRIQVSNVQYGMWTDAYQNWTDSTSGELNYTPTMSTLYRVSVSRPGYAPYTTTVEPKECALPSDCSTDFDCRNAQQCLAGNCVNLTGPACGFASNHTWHAYGCCADDACAGDEYCLDHECLKFAGACGYAANHQWYPYTCCVDSECGSGEACVDHACVKTADCVYDKDCLGTQRCSGSVCVNIVGECGYAANNRWNTYQCCSDSACATGKCVNNACSGATPVPLATQQPPPLGSATGGLVAVMVVIVLLVVVVAAAVLLPIAAGSFRKPPPLVKPKKGRKDEGGEEEEYYEA